MPRDAIIGQKSIAHVSARCRDTISGAGIAMIHEIKFSSAQREVNDFRLHFRKGVVVILELTGGDFRQLCRQYVEDQLKLI